MNGLVILGATSEIGSHVLDLCLKENTFSRYFLYARNVKKLNIQGEKSDKIVCIPYEMGIGDNISMLSKEIIVQDMKEITILMLAHTIYPIEEIGLMGVERIRENINTNVFSQVTFVDYFCALAKENGISLKVIYIDSGAAYAPINGWSLYCSSKAYMSMYMQCLQKEQGIPTVLFEPGVIDTAMQETIRTSNCKAFDRIDEFREYKEKGMLNSPAMVAGQLYERYLKQWTAVEIKEKIRR